MTITTLVARNEYTASAAQTVFNYTFKIYTNTDLNVYITPSGQDSDDSLDITTAYTVDPGTIGAPGGGFITLDSGTSSGDLVTIVSNIPENRTTDYQNSGDFLPDTVNDDFDRNVSLIKQQDDRSSRTLAFEESQQNASALTFPKPDPLKFLRWKATPTGLENVDLTVTGPPTDSSVIIYDPPFTGSSVSDVETKLAQTITPLDFGAIGDDVATDTIPMQAFLDASEANGVEGDLLGLTYLCGALRIGVNATMRNGTLHALDSLPAGTQLLLNKDFGSPSATVDNNILIEDVTFISTDPSDRTTNFLGFVRCGNLTLNRVTITGPKYQGLAIDGCIDSHITDIAISKTGKAAVTADGGSALWIGTTSAADTDNLRVTRPHIFDTEWHAMQANGSNIFIDDCNFTSIKEAGIFGDSKGVFINGGNIQGVTRKDISASGIEYGGDNIEIGGGLCISDVDNVAIALTDTQSVNINGISTFNCRRDAAQFPTAPHISILSTTADPDGPRHISITGHLAFDSSLPADSAVQVAGQGAGALCIAVSIKGNNYGAVAWGSGKAVSIASAFWGNECAHSDNNGSHDDNATSVDRGDNSVSLQSGVDEEVQRFATAITVPQTVGLQVGTTNPGARFKIVRTGLGAGTLDVGGLKTIPAATAATVEVTYDTFTSAWVLTGFELL